MRKALIASLAVLAALIVVAAATGRSTTPTAAAAIPGCAKDKLGLLDSDSATLTVGADNPAFPPWFGGDEKTKPWKVSDPYSGKGYESAVAYAVAKQLGFSHDAGQVDRRPLQQLVPARARSRSTSTSRRCRTARSGQRRSTSRRATTSSTRRSSR